MEPTSIAQSIPTLAHTLAQANALAPGRVASPKTPRTFQARTPVITGEAHYKGTLAVDGMIGGQVNGNNGSLGVRQRSGTVFSAQPELSGEISFQEMVRVNGHIAGTIYSQKGTLIVETHATVEADVEVSVAVINGTVRGNIIAQERVEIGSGARIYGNIFTRSIAVKDGATFEGVCTMLEGPRDSG